jgi:hypothetical protein
LPIIKRAATPVAIKELTCQVSAPEDHDHVTDRRGA